MPSSTRTLVLAIAAAAAAWWSVLLLLPADLPHTEPCTDDRPGLWLRIEDGDARLFGRAPSSAAARAVIVATDHGGGYVVNRSCRRRWPAGPRWSHIVQAVFGAPFNLLRQGTIVVQDDFVVVAGTTTSERRREALASAVRGGLAREGLAGLPVLFEVTVAPDPALPGRLAQLDLRFASGSHVPDLLTRHALAQVHHALKGSDVAIVVVGHADAAGSRSANDAIATRRAETIRDILVQSGIPAERITAEGRGAREPREDDRTPEGRAANRRVEVRVGPAR